MRFFPHCSKTKRFFVIIFETLYSKKFKLNADKITFGIKYKVGIYASNFLETSPKAIIYRLFKTEHIYEPYLNILSLKVFTRFRLCNHRLPIETGRWLNIPRGEGIRIMCNQGCIGDEFHYLFQCTVLNDLRSDICLLIIVNILV